MLTRRIAAAVMALGLGGAAVTGGALLIAEPAGAAPANAPTVSVAQPARAMASSPAADPTTAQAQPSLLVPTSPASSAAPTSSAPASEAPTAAATSDAPASEEPSPSAVRSSARPTATSSRARSTSTATPTSRLSGTPVPYSTRTQTVYRTYAPVYSAPAYTGGGTTETGDPYPYSGAAGDLPSGAAATGQPVATATVKAATSANPVYVSAATGGSTTQRKYIDVSGISINEILGDTALVGAILGLLGGLGLWLTRGAR